MTYRRAAAVIADGNVKLGSKSASFAVGGRYLALL